MYLIFDTETTGLPRNKTAPVEDLDNWPRLVQIAWQLHDSRGSLLSRGNHIVKPEGFTIPFNAEKVHGISTERALEVGQSLKEVLETFVRDIKKTRTLVGHNIVFDIPVLGAEYLRTGADNPLAGIEHVDTMTQTTAFCKLEGGRGGTFKPPKLTELHEKLFGEPFRGAHDAAYDVEATAKILFECLKQGIIPPAADGISPGQIAYQAPDLEASNFAWIRKKDRHGTAKKKIKLEELTAPFCHLHGHSQFSVLQATSEVEAIVGQAKACDMPAVAITDLGNMFGAFKFVNAARRADIKAIVGCEFYVAEERKKLKFTKDEPDKRFKQVLLAKTKKGYQNLLKLTSIAYKEGYYGLYPRIDKALIDTYKEDLIALSGGLGGEIPHLVLNVGDTQAEKALLWWKTLFGKDFYLELNRHGLEEEDRLNETLIRFADKHHVPLVAANEYYYLHQTDARAHDVLICIKENEKQSTPIGKGRGYRQGLPNDRFYFKTQVEMKNAFLDIPEAIENIRTLIDSIEIYSLEQEVLLPKFDIPEAFADAQDKKDGGKRGENAYLRHLAYEGAKQRYDTLTDAIRERLDFELKTIEKTGYPGYFLIVQDLTARARQLGVSVGPGRGSAAGSVVAYCTGITNVDPIAYDLLFERFLNPDRISLPDIDIDFDNEGRDKIIDYVVKKYGFDQVAQIITYGTMAPKSAIRDAGRVMDLPLTETDALAKLVPEKPGTTFSRVFGEIQELQTLRQGQDLPAQVLNQAVVLEGSLRNTGIHACGVIITPEDMSNLIPMARSKESELLVTQYDNSVVEAAGMLKMDFLGLKTLSIIRTALENIKARHGVEVDLDKIELDDPKTYRLYQRGETNGTFQFESPGMQKHLRALKPDRFEDLIAMNALYRPGPMEYIPDFIARKHGREPIVYDIPDMEEFLAETYGITVYQEQVMLLSQKLAGFTRGEADVLRKAMGKKKREVLDQMKPQFIAQARDQGYEEKKLEKVWKDWEAFAAYAFNKSHSTCYSVIAYQTGYLKANYPAAYMAAVLTHNQGNTDKVKFFMEECKNRSIPVLGPHLNESLQHFAVNQEGEIRFGLGAIKGTGEAAVQAIVDERGHNGPFEDIFDFARRVNLRSVNKKSFESLARAGAFDCFKDYHRRQYVEPDEEGTSLAEKAIRYANRFHEEQASAQSSLFGDLTAGEIAKPKAGKITPYSGIEQLNIEKDLVGMYITGHPLDQYRLEIEQLANTPIGRLADLEQLKGKELRIAGVISDVQHRISKRGNPFGQFTLEDFNDRHTFYLFSQDYLRFKPMLEPGWFLFISATVQNRWDSSELELKIHRIEHLSEIRDKRVEGLALKIGLENIDEELIRQIEQQAARFPGKKQLKLSLVGRHQDRQIVLDMISRTLAIGLENELIEALTSIDRTEVTTIIKN